MRKTIKINKEILPYNFNILLGNEVYNIRVNFNNTGDFFTADLKKENDIICMGERIVYGRTLFSDVYLSGKFPTVDIIPYCESKEINAVTFDNLSETVLLIINDGSEQIE